MTASLVKHSIECWIFDRKTERFLLLECPENNHHTAYWQPVTGGIESGEDKMEACLREIREETGTLIDERDVVKLLDDYRVYASDRELHKTVYVVETDDFTVSLSDEHIGFRWVAPSDVFSMLLWGSNRVTFQRVLEFLEIE